MKELDPDRNDHLSKKQSFVIRLWREPYDSKNEWRGWIQHIHSDKKSYVKSFVEINDFMKPYLADSPIGLGNDEQDG